ncbi:small hydrophilic protein [Streptomyces sp. NPDC002793]|uniref:small hydrophilic protein n=1 Tax=Streptomyces sp. NPDC002793 TaxID=3154432 RepID=UPI00331D65CF
MAFSHRIATLAAVVAIPLGIAATSYALADSPARPEVPARVDLDRGSPSGSPDPGSTAGPGPDGSTDPSPGSTDPTAPPSDVVVPQPPATDTDDDDADDTDDDGTAGADDDGNDDG